jgi:hypothetical protein
MNFVFPAGLVECRVFSRWWVLDTGNYSRKSL